jgi:hypothetical protein
MALSRNKNDSKVVALRYERNEQVQMENVSATDSEASKEQFSEALLWALNECETNDLSLDDRTVFANHLTISSARVRPLNFNRPATTAAATASRQYYVHSHFPLLVSDYFHPFKSSKLVRNLCLLQDYQIVFNTERVQPFPAMLVRSYCKLLDEYSTLF